MKTTSLFAIPAIAAAVIVSGCTGGSNAHYIKTGGQESVVTVGQINIQDFMTAADQATSDLLGSGVLNRVTNPPAVLAISRIVNNTSEQIDTDLLIKKIRVALLQSGKAVTTTTFAALRRKRRPGRPACPKHPAAAVASAGFYFVRQNH